MALHLPFRQQLANSARLDRGHGTQETEETIMKKTILAALAAATISTFAGTAPAMAWTEIAQRNVADRIDVDTVSLPGDREYRRIKLCVYRHPVHFIDIDIWFRNGGHQDINTAYRINPGQCTRDIDLDGGSRNIDHIVLKYEETSVRRRTATVRIFAE